MDLFSQYELGNIRLSNRMVMAPMTRCRAIEGNIPNPLAITYYATEIPGRFNYHGRIAS